MTDSLAAIAPTGTAVGRSSATAASSLRGRRRPGVVAVAVGSMRCSRYEALAGGGGRARLNSDASTEAIRPCNPQGACGARHEHTRSTFARHRIRHGIRHTAALAGRGLRPHVANGRLRHRLIGSARVSTADGSPSLAVPCDALQAPPPGPPGARLTRQRAAGPSLSARNASVAASRSRHTTFWFAKIPGMVYASETATV